MEKFPILMLQFRGNRREMHAQLKKWCEKSDRSMVGTVMELIKIHLKKNHANK